MPKFSFATTMSMLCIKSNKELKWKCSQMRITIHNEVQSLRKLKSLHRTMPNVLDSRWQDTLRYTEHIHELEQFATSIRYQTVFFLNWQSDHKLGCRMLGHGLTKSCGCMQRPRTGVKSDQIECGGFKLWGPMPFCGFYVANVFLCLV